MITVIVAFIVLIGVFFYDRRAKSRMQRTLAKYRAEEERDAAEEAQKPAVTLAPLPPAAAKSVDLQKLSKADPGFSDREFLAIARETFLLVNEAKMRGVPQVARDLLLGDLEAALPTSPSPTPGLEISEATITTFKKTGDNMLLTVTFAILGYEAQSDQETTDLPEPRRWSEEWDFVRSATTSTAPDDPTSRLPGWMVAHKGWLVSAIRIGASTN